MPFWLTMVYQDGIKTPNISTHTVATKAVTRVTEMKKVILKKRIHEEGEDEKCQDNDNRKREKTTNNDQIITEFDNTDENDHDGWMYWDEDLRGEPGQE